MVGANRARRSRRQLCGVAIIIAKHSGETLVTLHRAVSPADLIAGLDDLVVKALVISLSVKMSKIRSDGSTQRVLAEENHFVKRFFF